MTKFDTVCVIGAGTMGNGIAQTFASYGTNVRLVDVNADALAKGLGTIEKSLARFVKKEKLTQDEADAIRGRIQGSGAVADAGDAKLVVEAIVEKAEVKRAVFEELDRVTPQETILATNTSSISITEIAAATQRADRVIGMHFMNPVPLMKLVEVIRGQETSDETTQTVMAASEAIGKVPVEANDYPGVV